MAGETNWDLDWEGEAVGSTAFTKFSGVEEHDSHQHQVVNSPLYKDYTRSGYIECHPGDIWSNNNTVRCLCANYGTGESGGQTYFFAKAFRLPSGDSPLGDNTLIWELHHPASLYNQASLGVAPHAITVRNDGAGYNFCVRMMTGKGTPGQGWGTFLDDHAAAQRIGAVVFDTWVSILQEIKFSEGNDGYRKVWIDRTGAPPSNFGNGTPDWQQLNLPTMPYTDSPSVHNVSLYTEMGIYTGGSTISKQMIIYYAGAWRRTTKAAAQAKLNINGGGGDVSAPTVPAGLGATALSASSIRLTWTTSTDNVAVTGYLVKRGGVQVANITANSPIYTDTGLAASTAYTYTVAAYDAAGNTSAFSSSAGTTTLSSGADVTAPTTPTNLTVQAISDTQINLTWTASTDAVGVTGYNVYRDSNLVATPATNSYQDQPLQPSTTYTYTVAAFDAAGNVSGVPGTVSATTLSGATGNFDTVPVGWLGGSYVVTGTQVNGSSPNSQRCYRCVVTNSGTVTRIETYREPDNTVSGTETVVMAVWNDNGSGTDPSNGGALLGKAAPLNFTAGSPAGRYSSNVIAPFAVTAGQVVWIGELDNGQQNLAKHRYNPTVGVFRLMLGAPSNGVPAVWNTTTDQTFDLDMVQWLAGTPSASAAPTNITLPVIGGSAQVGQTMTVTNIGEWTGSPTGYTYQWQTDTLGNLSFANVSGETSSSYQCKTADIGDNVRVRITATNASGSLTVSTVHLGVVSAAPGRLANAVRTGSARVVNPAKRRSGQGGGG